jgi:hypothetical protein
VKTPTCPSGKICHRKQWQAEKHAESLQLKNGKHGRVYFCAHCNYWHTTSQSLRERKAHQIRIVNALNALQARNKNYDYPLGKKRDNR